MYRSNPFCSTKTPGLNLWKHLWTRKRENPKTRKREESTCGRENAKTAKTRKRRKQENRENGENAKTAKTRKRENGENPKTAKSVPVFWFSISRFLVFSVSRFLVFSFRWPHPSGQVAFFMCLVGSLQWFRLIRNKPWYFPLNPGIAFLLSSQVHFFTLISALPCPLFVMLHPAIFFLTRFSCREILPLILQEWTYSTTIYIVMAFKHFKLHAEAKNSRQFSLDIVLFVVFVIDWRPFFRQEGLPARHRHHPGSCWAFPPRPARPRTENCGAAPGFLLGWTAGRSWNGLKKKINVRTVS